MTKISEKTRTKLMNLVIYIIRSKSRPISTNEMAETLGRSWEYTIKLLRLMWKKKMIRKIKKGKYVYWEI